MLEYVEVNLEKQFKRDLDYIRTDLIALQAGINKKHICEETEEDKEDTKFFYIKFSKILNAVAIINMTKKQYKSYWKTQYKDYKDKLKIILDEIEEKFTNGLTSKEDMLNLIRESNDIQSEKDIAMDVLIFDDRNRHKNLYKTKYKKG